MRPEKRAALVRAAAHEFASRSFEEASLNRIIGECGLSKSSFYHVVESKEQLFSLVVSDLTATASQTWTPPEPTSFAEGFWTRAHMVWNDILATWPSSRALNQLWHIVYANEDNDQVRELSDRVRHWVHAVLTIGRESAAVDAECPLELQSLAVFSLLRTFDEWSLHLASAGSGSPTDPPRGSSVPTLDPAEAAAHQFRLLKRLLHP